MNKNTPPARRRRRIFIVEDHPLTRMGLASVIDHEPDMQVCHEAGSTVEALRSIEPARPDLVITDITLPDRSGIELIKDLKALRPNLPVLVVSMHDESIFAERVLRAGGRGYVMKDEGGRKVVEAIRKILNGEISVSNNVATKILCGLAGGGAKGASASDGPEVDHLSDRELEVYNLVGEGRDRHEIAHKLNISIKTVDVHRGNIRAKLGLGSPTELIRHAARWAEAGTTRKTGGA